MQGKPILTKVVIDGITIKDDSSNVNYLLDWSRTETLDGDTIRQITINCPRSVESILNVSEDLMDIGKEVLITRGVNAPDEEIIFRGMIKHYNLFQGIISFTCVDKLYITTKNKINYSYDKDIDPSAGVISEIFKDMINTYTPLTADDSSVQYTGTALTRDKVICKSDSVFDKIFNELAEPTNWNIYYNPVTDKVNFEPKGFTNNNSTLETGINITNKLNWKTDETNVFNFIEVQGAEQEIQTIENGQVGVSPGYTTESIQLTQIPNIVRVLCDDNNPPTTELVGGVIGSTSSFDYSVDATKKQIIFNNLEFTANLNDYVSVEYSFNRPTPIVVSDSGSIAKYGKKDLTLIKSNIRTVADARLYANAVLSDHKQPVLSTTIQVTDIADLRPGQRVRVVDSLNNIDGLFYITSLKQSYPYAYDEVKVVSNIQDTDKGFFLFVLNKLVQLDRQSKDDFESLIQVISIDNQFIYENRFIKIKKIELSGNTLIWDNEIYGYWDINYWYSTPSSGFIDYDVLLETMEHKYIELFYDDLFKNTTDGIWDVVNEELRLDNTKQAISKPFCLDLLGATNAYKSANISITGINLDDLEFYIGENTGGTMIYNFINLVGTSYSKTGNINLINTNKFGLVWKAISNADGVIIKQININYNK